MGKDLSTEFSAIDTDYSQKGLSIKIRLRFGMLGHLTLFEVLNWINADKGCYAECKDMTDTAVAFAITRLGSIDYAGKVEEIFRYMLEIGYFDPEAYTKEQILTSEGIVKRWAKAKRRSGPETFDLPAGVREILERLVAENAKPVTKNAKLVTENAKLVTENRSTSKAKLSKAKALPPLTPPAGGNEGEAEIPAELPEDGLTEPEREVIEAWNRVFPAGDPRHLTGPPYPLNGFFLPNLHKSLSEGFTLEQFSQAFTSLKTGKHSWQLHSAVKPDNVRMLLTERQRASPKTARDYTNPNDYLALGATHG